MIKLGEKQHKLTFRDQIGKGEIQDTFIVESYKAYNASEDA